MKECFWCSKLFEATIHNCVHVGGHGDVYGYDECLGLAPPEKGQSVKKLEATDALTNTWNLLRNKSYPGAPSWKRGL